MLCSNQSLCVVLATVLSIIVTIVLAQQETYPTYNEVPQGLSFTCSQRTSGYYADPETGCQVWHWCLPSGQKFSFLCPNGTLFNQNYRVCDWHYNVDCPSAPDHYSVNDDLYRDKDGNYI